MSTEAKRIPKTEKERDKGGMVSKVLLALKGLNPEGKADSQTIFNVIYLAERHKLAHYGSQRIGRFLFSKSPEGPIPVELNAFLNEIVDFAGNCKEIIWDGKCFVTNDEPDLRYVSMADKDGIEWAVSAFLSGSETVFDWAYNSVDMWNTIPSMAMLYAGSDQEEHISLIQKHRTLEEIRLATDYIAMFSQQSQVIECTPLLGQFVIYGINKIGRLIGLVYSDSPVDQDLYYVIFDGKKLVFSTCVGKVYRLKGLIDELAYSFMVHVATLNHYDQPLCTQSPIPWQQFREETAKLGQYDNWITPVVWDIN